MSKLHRKIKMHCFIILVFFLSKILVDNSFQIYYIISFVFILYIIDIYLFLVKGGLKKCDVEGCVNVCNIR